MLAVLWAEGTGVRRRLVLGLVLIAVLSFSAWLASKMVHGLAMVGYVDSAIGRVRSIAAAEEQFVKAHPDIGYTCTLSQLAPNEQITRLLKDGKDNGYIFKIAGCGSMKPNSTYQIIARPLHSGLPAYCSDQSGILRSDGGGSVEKCMAQETPLSS
jgi:hypothetical protein